ncbi:MAG: carboxypeptidase-like regulatory domain-containing protein [Cytophagales bacterium]|nr:carboxypeptidase-like regulatory domain-containing protein [Cytophagales bacterium]
MKNYRAKSKHFLALCGVCWALVALGQKAPNPVTVGQDLTEVPIAVFAAYLRSAHGIAVYHPPSLDSLHVSARAGESLYAFVTNNLPGKKLHGYFNPGKGYLIISYTPIEVPELRLELRAEVPQTEEQAESERPQMGQGQTQEEDFFIKEEQRIARGQVRSLVVGKVGERSTGERALVKGQVRMGSTGEPVIGATVRVQELGSGTLTDYTGQFELRLLPGRYTWQVQSMGLRQAELQVDVQGPGEVAVEMELDYTQLKAVTVSAHRESNVSSTEMGKEKMEITEVKRVPVALGEADIMKVAVMLPGVQSTGEGAPGFNVRGGAVDQNLLLLEKAPIFNSSHVFGFSPRLIPTSFRTLASTKVLCRLPWAAAAHRCLM